MVEQAFRDENHIPALLGTSSSDGVTVLPVLIDESTGRVLVDDAGNGGTVTSVSVVTANGFAGTVATATTTPAITLTTTITGILQGNGTAISAATTTGSGAVVLATSPSLTTPSIAGATLTGVIDAGGADSFELPNSDTPTVNANGEIAVDNSVADFSAGVLKYYSTEEMGVVAMPVAQFTTPTNGYVVAYNSTNDEFELVAQSGGGQVDSVVGTADRITVNSTDPVNPVVDIASTYVGQTSITTLGTIATGTWNGTTIAVANGGTGVTTSTGTGSVVLSNSPTLITPALGVATATSINGNTITTGTGTLTLGAGSTLATSATNSITLTSTGATNVTLPTTGTLSTLAGSETFTNKRIQPRSSTAASGDITPALATANIWQRTALSAGITINAPTGTPVLGEVLVFMLIDDGTSRSLTWNAAFIPMGQALPTATTISKELLVTASYNGAEWETVWAEEQ